MSKRVVYAFFALVGLSVAPMVHAEEGAVKGRTDLRSFFQGYLAESKGEVPSLKVPAIWLFSPDGRFVARIDEAAGAAALPETIGKPTGASVSAVDFPKIGGILEKQGISVPANAKGQWTALLLSREPCAELCQSFHQTLDGVRKKQPERLRVVDLTLTL